MPSITPAELQTVADIIGGQILASAVCRLYKASKTGPTTPFNKVATWTYTGITGALCLVQDNSVKSAFLRIASFNDTPAVLYEQELYMNMEYAEARPFFHHFEGSDAVHGLSFADDSEAHSFYEILNATVPRASASPAPAPRPSFNTSQSARSLPGRQQQPQPPVGAPPLLKPPAPGGNHGVPKHALPAKPPAGSRLSNGGTAPSAPAAPAIAKPPVPPRSDLTPATESSSHSTPAPPYSTPAPVVVAPVVTPAPTPAPVAAPTPAPALTNSNKAGLKKERSFFSKIFAREEALQDIAISAPRDFRHQGHIGWDPANGFDVINIPPEWKKLFAAAKIKKSELTNPETSKFVMETIIAQTSGTAPPDPTQAASAAAAAAPAISPPHLVPPPSLATPATLSPRGPASPRDQQTSPRANPTVPPAPPRISVPPAGATAAAAPPAPPPPPPPGAPKPPPAPVHATPVTAAPAAPAAAPKGSFLADIQRGKELRHVDPEQVPDLKTMNPTQQNTLAETLAAAMQARRGAIAHEEEEAQAGDDDWSV